ncbi:MAG TPA: hypothetical protein VKX17_03640 [Planctomycetota bacterium]|nr:hypothetical protein [Planctomycetota bacterium]
MTKLFALIACLSFSFATLRADDGKDLEIQISAPLQAVDAVNNTVTVLGLTIAVPASVLTDGVAAGQFVTIHLASDTAPLAAVSLSLSGAYASAVTVQAPLQAVDGSANTVTLLGLAIDISSAAICGCNDNSTQTTPCPVSALTAGQSAEVVLDSSKLPALAALKVAVKNFTNQVGVVLCDGHGNEIADPNGTSINVTQSLKVKDSLSGKMSHKTVNLHSTTTGGDLSLAGLAPGRATFTITRNGKTFRKTITVGANDSETLKVKVPVKN